MFSYLSVVAMDLMRLISPTKVSLNKNIYTSNFHSKFNLTVKQTMIVSQLQAKPNLEGCHLWMR